MGPQHGLWDVVTFSATEDFNSAIQYMLQIIIFNKESIFLRTLYKIENNNMK